MILGLQSRALLDPLEFHNHFCQSPPVYQPSAPLRCPSLSMHLGPRGCCRCLDLTVKKGQAANLNRQSTEKKSRFDKLSMLDASQNSQDVHALMLPCLPKSSGIGDMIQSHPHLPQRLYCHDLSNLSYRGAYLTADSFARCWRCALLKLKYGSSQKHFYPILPFHFVISPALFTQALTLGLGRTLIPRAKVASR